jgi:hypothetical protein
MSSYTVPYPSLLREQFAVHSSLKDPAHVKLDKVYRRSRDASASVILDAVTSGLGAIASGTAGSLDRQYKRQRKLDLWTRDLQHDCLLYGCPVLREVHPTDLTVLDGFSSEATIKTCHSKLVSDTIDNVSPIFQVESVLTSTDLDYYQHHLNHIKQTSTTVSSAGAQQQQQQQQQEEQPAVSIDAIDAEISRLPPADLDLESDVVQTLEVPSTLNSSLAVNERKRLGRDFLVDLDNNGGFVVVSYLPRLHTELLKSISKTALTAKDSQHMLDVSSAIGSQHPLGNLLPVKTVSASEGIVRVHACKATLDNGWSFEPASVMARERAAAGYRFKVYVPRDGLAQWAPTVKHSGGHADTRASHGSLNSLGYATAHSRAAASFDSDSATAIQFNTPQHIVYPFWVDYAMAMTAQSRSVSFNSFPEHVLNTKHDLKALTAMSEIERNRVARLQRDRDAAIQQQTQNGSQILRFRGNPLMSTQLIPGELVTASQHFLDTEAARQRTESENKIPEIRVTTLTNTSGEATLIGNSKYGQGAMRGIAGEMNPTPVESVTSKSKTPNQNSFRMLQALIQQAANVGTKASARIPDQMHHVAPELQLAYSRAATYTGEPPRQLYDQYRKMAAEQYKIPPHVLQSSLQGQWGISRNVPPMNVYNRSMITAVLNLESRGYGEFISCCHSEMAAFFLWLYELCFSEYDNELMTVVFEEELEKSQLKHDEIIKLHNQYETQWKKYEMAVQSENVDQVENLSDSSLAGPANSNNNNNNKDIRSKAVMLQTMEQRMIISHRQYMQLTQYLYLLALAAQGQMRLQVDFIPTRRFMDAVEQERINQETKAISSKRTSQASSKGSSSSGGNSSS